MKGKFALMIFFLLATVAAFAATQPTVVYTFSCTGNASLRIGTCPQGGRPDSIFQSTDGNFYGTAQVSQEGSSTPTGGTVFSLTPSGTFKVLHTFTPGTTKNYANGNLPGNLVEGSDGKLYGTTLFGGVGGCNGYCGSGVLYRVNKDGTGFQIIHRFCSATNCADGSEAPLVAGTDGNLYGASAEGGTGTCNSLYPTCGAIFRVTPSTGAYAIVFSFNSSSGFIPSGLTAASDGTFYGMDENTSNRELFHYSPSTNTVTAVTLPFPSINGLPSRPASGLTIGANGNLYGIYIIYATPGAGVFEVAPDGSNFQLFPFYTSQNGAGAPQQLISATDDNFYLIDYNGSSGYGDIKELSPSNGALIQTLSLFGANNAVGAYPAFIMQATDGTFRVSTGQYGKVPTGHFADGTIFSLNLGLPPK
jgi:uncharacterized repeat protein (TIGR03803 family)